MLLPEVALSGFGRPGATEMRVLITGADGFVGRALARRLIDVGTLGAKPVERLLLLDLQLGGELDPARVAALPGDIADATLLERAFAGRIDAVFHLASIPGGTAEQQYALARRVNLDATLALLERCKAQVEAGGPVPVFVFASTIAVFGTLTGPVDDATPTRPVMSYGMHKLVGELLVADFSRRGWIDGRALRLPGVLARPPARTGQLSAFLSDILRQPAAGRPFVCPTSPQATTWASSLPCVVEQLLHGAAVSAAALPATRALTLPTRRASMAELVEAVGRVYGTPAADLVRYAPDERIEALFGRFPPLATPAAEAAGFRRDATLDELVRRALE